MQTKVLTSWDYTVVDPAERNEHFHYENMSVQYEAISKSGKNDNFRCKNVTLDVKAVLTSTHNLCFRAKIRKMYTPVNPISTI